MINESPWASYVRSYRLMHMLTQTEFAERFGVSPPTVSRWETGRQEPSLEVQKVLQAYIDVKRLMTEAAWCERVHNAHNYELLFSPKRGLISASVAARDDADVPAGTKMSRYARDIFPGGPDALTRELAPFGYSSLPDIGLFFGLVRQVYLVVDCRFATRVVSRGLDIWPLVSADDIPLVHAVGDDLPLCQDPESVRDLRIRVCDVSGTQPPLGRPRRLRKRMV